MGYVEDKVAGEPVRTLHGPEGAMVIRREMHCIGHEIGAVLSCCFSDRAEAEQLEYEVGQLRAEADSGWTDARLVKAELVERSAHRQALDAIRALGRGLRIALGNDDPSINGQASGLTADEFLLISSVMGAK